MRTTEFELLQLSEPRLVHFGDIGVPHGKMVTFKSVNLITVKALLSAMGFHLGMTEVAPWSDQKRNRRIEAYQSNRELPPVLVRRIITQRQEKILRMRWGIGEERPHLLREVALLFNLSTGKIQRMEASAHSKFSNYIRKKLKWEDAIPEGNGEKWREWIEKLIEMQNNVPILFPESQ
ncbi:MAG: hypothetical protein OXM55_02900 [Bdellovibrionales bacterium]|nr:hypothetical protein [Bdellovibrionales bacterium]